MALVLTGNTVFIQYPVDIIIYLLGNANIVEPKLKPIPSFNSIDGAIPGPMPNSDSARDGWMAYMTPKGVNG